MNKLQVAVLMGGNSSEREVSLNSGKEVLANLDKGKYEAVGIDVPSELNKLNEIKPDVVFLAMHGAGGEDGQIQGYLGTLGYKYTGSGVLASAIGMNKLVFRQLMEKAELPMPDLVTGIPCVVKPVNGGSSVGVTIVKRVQDLDAAKANALKYDQEIMMEDYIEGTEVTCGVLGNDKPLALPVIEIKPKKEFFDYEAKYVAGMSEEICPAKLSEVLTEQIQRLAVEVFKLVGAKGYARIDFMIRNNKPLVLEINTLPGMTPNSLLPKAAKAAGMSYPQLLDKMIELASES